MVENKLICVTMSCDGSLHKDYSQELLHFNWKQLEKCSYEKCQWHQTKLNVVETAETNRTQLKDVRAQKLPTYRFF